MGCEPACLLAFRDIYRMCIQYYQAVNSGILLLPCRATTPLPPVPPVPPVHWARLLDQVRGHMRDLNCSIRT